VVVTRVAPPDTAPDVEIDEGATVDLGSVPPHEALTTAAATASAMSEARGLGNCNDIGYSWRKIPTADFGNMR
jgi:hypothetical protein